MMNRVMGGVVQDNGCKGAYRKQQSSERMKKGCKQQEYVRDGMRRSEGIEEEY